MPCTPTHTCFLLDDDVSTKWHEWCTIGNYDKVTRGCNYTTRTSHVWRGLAKDFYKRLECPKRLTWSNWRSPLFIAMNSIERSWNSREGSWNSTEGVSTGLYTRINQSPQMDILQESICLCTKYEASSHNSWKWCI